MPENTTVNTATLPLAAIFGGRPKPRSIADLPIGPPTADELEAIKAARAQRLEAKRATLIRQRPELELRVATQRRLLESAEAALKANHDEADRLGEAVESLRDDDVDFTPTAAELAYRAAHLRERAALASFQAAEKTADEARQHAGEFGREHPFVSSAHADAVDAKRAAEEYVGKAIDGFGQARGKLRHAQFTLEKETAKP